MSKIIKSLEAKVALKDFTGDIYLIVALPISWQRTIKDGDQVPSLIVTAMTTPAYSFELVGTPVE